MRRLTVTAPGELRWLDADEPTLEADDDALVRPVAVTLCDLDRPMATGAFPLPLPIPFGHEFVGEVTAVGPAVAGVAPGDRVVVPFQISCGRCDRCREGLTANCEAVPARSQYGFGEAGGPWGGGFSDLVRVPFADHMLVAVPPGVASEVVAAAGDNVGDGFRAVAPHLRHRPGGDVLVLGGIGSVPLYAAMFAVALGAGRVDYVDADPERRAVAEQVGARARPEPAAGERYDIAVDGTLLDPDGLARAAGALRPDGTVTGVTMYLDDPTIPYLQMYARGVHFHTGRVHARAVLPEVLALVAAGRVHPEVVTGGDVRPWDEAPTLLGPGTKPVFVR